MGYKDCVRVAHHIGYQMNQRTIDIGEDPISYTTEDGKQAMEELYASISCDLYEGDVLLAATQIGALAVYEIDDPAQQELAVEAIAIEAAYHSEGESALWFGYYRAKANFGERDLKSNRLECGFQELADGFATAERAATSEDYSELLEG